MAEVPEVPVGTSVTCPLFRYHPPTLAQAIATLDNMYPGRFNLGVGTGEALNEAHFVDEWPDWGTRASMLVESIDVMRTLWTTDEYVGYDGNHYQYDAIKLYTRPKASIDIHWAAWGPQSCRLAGEHADHLLSVGPPEMFADRVIPGFETGIERSGRRLQSVDVSAEMAANYGDPDALVDEIRDCGEYIPDETELDTPDPRETQAVADERLATMSDAAVADASNITDDPDDFVDLIERYAEAGVTRVIVGSQCGDPEATIEVFEDHVIPRFA